MQHGELRSYRGSRLVKFVLWIFIDFKDTFKTDESFLTVFQFVSFLSRIQIREREDQTELTSFQYLCQVRLMINQGDLMIHKPIKPKIKSKENHDRTERPVIFWDPEVATRIQGNFGGWRNSSTRRFSRQFFSWSVFRAHIQKTWGFV